MTDVDRSTYEHEQAAAPDLDAWLLEPPEGMEPLPSDDEGRERWTITDDAAATWAVRTYAAAQEERGRIRQAAQAEIDRIQRWAEAADCGPARTVEVMTGKLADYHRALAEQADREGRKFPAGYKLAAGTIKRNPGRPKVEVLDETAFTDWAVANWPAAVTRRPAVSALADLPDDDGRLIDPASGEPVPGVRRRPAIPSYSIAPAGDLFGPF